MTYTLEEITAWSLEGHSTHSKIVLELCEQIKRLNIPLEKEKSVDDAWERNYPASHYKLPFFDPL